LLSTNVLAKNPENCQLTLMVADLNPASQKFQVCLDFSGKLTITKEQFSPPGDDRNKEKIISLNLEEASKLMMLAKEAVDFSEKGEELVSHPTYASLELNIDKELVKRVCNACPHWPSGERTRELLNAINSYFPPEFTVY